MTDGARWEMVGNYPVVIDPTVAVLEATTGTGKQERWRPLHRQAPAVLPWLALPPSVVHLFGTSPDFKECGFFLAYDTCGGLSHVGWLTSEGWQSETVPEEITGKLCCLPSLRLVFKDERSREVFLYYLDQVERGAIANPCVAQALGSLAGPIRAVDVACKEPSTGS